MLIKKYYNIYLHFILLIIILFFYIFLVRDKTIESFDLTEKETFTYTLMNIDNLKILDINKYIYYNNTKITSQIGQNIYFNIFNKLDNKKYIIFRYPDFRNEIKRHSRNNLNNYFNYIRKIVNRKNRYIFDYLGYHGVIDDKVRLWINLKRHYGRNVANKVMPKTYLIPNDLNLFLNEYKDNTKYILKNSFGGARSALKITKSKEEIISHFNINRQHNYNPLNCEDAACHSKVKYNIIQEYVDNTFLMKGYKFGIRLFLILIENNDIINRYVFKDGFCYYSLEKHDTSTNINNNVVGSIFKTDDIKKKNNLPTSYIDFLNYLKYTLKFSDIFIKRIQNKINYNLSLIVKSNISDISEFKDFDNISKYSIFAFDIEFDKDFNPIIYEGNYYFTRFNSTHEIGKIVINMYNDIYYKLGLSNREVTGFYNLNSF